MAELNLSPSDASSGAAPDPGEEKMRRRVLRANCPSTAAAEEEMREAGAREVCEEMRGVGGMLARNNIAAVPKETKGKTRMKGIQEAWGAAGGRQGEAGICGDFADLALESSVGLEPLSALNVCLHISHTGGSMVSENGDIGNECSVCMVNKKNQCSYSVRSRLCLRRVRR
jgi:hypothetical protein